MNGWIYVMTNASIEGRVKIGFSMKDPRIRAKNDFDPAGLPDDYVVEYSALTENPREVEQKVHKHLREKRDKKEWFWISVNDAIDSIKNVIELDRHILFEKEYTHSYHLDSNKSKDIVSPFQIYSVKHGRFLDQGEMAPFIKTKEHELKVKAETEKAKRENNLKQVAAQMNKQGFVFCPNCNKKNMIGDELLTRTCGNCGVQLWDALVDSGKWSQYLS